MAAHKYVLCGSEYTEASACAITGTAGAGTTSLANLKTQYPSEIWRSAAGTSANHVIDLGSAKAVHGVFLGYTNFRPTDTTWRIRAATSEANLTASPDYDSGTVAALAASSYGSDYATDWPNGRDALLFSGGVTWTALATKQWWRIDYADAALPDGYFEAGVLRFLGPGWSPANGVQYGAAVPAEELTSSWQRSQDGILFPAEVATPQAMEFEFQELTFTEHADLRAVIRSRRSYKDVVSLWLNGEGDAEDSTIHGFIADYDAPKARFFDTYRASLTIKSAGATS